MYTYTYVIRAWSNCKIYNFCNDLPTICLF